MMDSFENLLALIEWVHLYKRLNLNFSFEHHGERVRVPIGRASPISSSGGIEGHQIGQAHFDFLRGVSHDGEVSARVEQAEGSLLAGGRPAGFEDLEAEPAPAALFGK